jgi:pimeloyl-ACP methyl ester carboxylesterase
MPPLSLSARLVAPGGTSPLLPRERIDALLARLPHREGRVPGAGGVPLHFIVFDPGDYRMRYRYLGETGHVPDFSLDVAAPARSTAPRGTVVLLHGWMMDSGSMLPWAAACAGRLPQHRPGPAQPRRIRASLSGYGTREAKTWWPRCGTARAAKWSARCTCWGVLRCGHGHLRRARSRPQVGGVVAMESFDNAGAAIRAMVPHMLARAPERWSDYIALPFARWRYGGQNLDAAIAEADRTLGLDLDKVDVGAALARRPAACC